MKKLTTAVEAERRSKGHVLVCILCQTRARELTWAYFKKNVLDVLNADLALCIGIDTNYDYSNPFWQHAKYRWTVKEIDDYGVGFDEAQRRLTHSGCSVPNLRKLLEIKDQWLGAEGYRATLLSAALAQRGREIDNCSKQAGNT